MADKPDKKGRNNEIELGVHGNNSLLPHNILNVDEIFQWRANENVKAAKMFTI